MKWIVFWAVIIFHSSVGRWEDSPYLGRYWNEDSYSYKTDSTFKDSSFADKTKALAFIEDLKFYELPQSKNEDGALNSVGPYKNDKPYTTDIRMVTDSAKTGHHVSPFIGRDARFAPKSSNSIQGIGHGLSLTDTTSKHWLSDSTNRAIIDKITMPTTVTPQMLLLDSISREWSKKTAVPQGPASMCKERGHIMGSVGVTTLVACPPYQIDYKDSTVMVYPVCNSTSSVCTRCGEVVSTTGKEQRVVIWRR